MTINKNQHNNIDTDLNKHTRNHKQTQKTIDRNINDNKNIHKTHLEKQKQVTNT